MGPFRITVANENSTVDDVKEILSSQDIVVVVAFASFVPRCKHLLKELEESPGETSSGVSDGSSTSSKSDDTLVLLINTDQSDDLEEAAIDLGLNDIPSFQVYRNGNLLESFSGNSVTTDSIRAAVKTATVATLSVSCCKPSGIGDHPTERGDILDLVRQSYANTLNNTEACCVSVDASLMGYTPEQIAKVGNKANLGLGCGNPLSFANLQGGETVVDLGSGAGIDCFLASEEVGPSGSVIGIDMTPEMIHRARQNARERKVEANNVQFRLGEIEFLPVADGTADCVISNCVINLSPDKAQVYREIYRVLRNGGRVAISDVVTRPKKVLPEELRTAEALAC